ncbi:CBS domain-containing protein [Rossellomorea sp. NS-SX7]|uniref:CBS domain-containing protein n=1 Tax=Rossellomorea sp. NS-SX7 TaxID=3463856 RepID=UPI00405A24E8
MNTTTYSQSERYEVAFNQIHEALKKQVKSRSDKFTSLVHAGRHHRVISTYQDELFQYAKLRNALVHEKTELGYYIAEPHRDVVERIEKIARVLTSPNYALTIATKAIIFFQMEDSIEDVINGIRTYNYSQYPIFQDGECVGLLTAKSIVKWLAERMMGSIVDLSHVKIKDVFQHEKEHPLAFAAKSSTIFDVEELFERYHQRKVDLEAIILTENGRKNEEPLGIVTAWDLIEIDYTAD